MPTMGGVGNVPEYVEEDSIDLRELFFALLRRKWIIISFFIVSVTAAVIASLLATPVYEATSTIMVQDQSASPLAIFEALGAPAKNTNQNYVEVLKSITLAETAMEKLGYDFDIDSPEFVRFKNSISVQLATGTDAIRIKAQHTDPAEAARVANAVVDAFMDLNQEVNTEGARSAREFIGDQLKVVEADLYKAEETLRKYKEEQRVIAPSEEAKAVLDQLVGLEKDKAQTSIALTQVKSQLATLNKKLKAESPTTITSTTIANNPLVAQYKARLFELETQLSVLKTQYEDNHPRITTLTTEIASVREGLSKEVERIVSTETKAVNPNYVSLLQQTVGLEVENVAQQARQDALEQQITKVEKSLAALPSKEVELTRLMRNQSVLEQVYLLLKNKYEEYRITEAVEASGISVVDRARIPKDPVKPKKKQNVMIGGVLGLMVGVGLALLLEFMDTTIKIADDVQRYLGLPVLGSIPVDEAEPSSTKRRRHRRRRQPSHSVAI